MICNCQIKQELRAGHKAIIKKKPSKVYLEVMDEGHLRVKNVRDISSSMCQIWYAKVKTNRSNGSDTNLQKSRRTDRQSDRQISI